MIHKIKMVFVFLVLSPVFLHAMESDRAITPGQEYEQLQVLFRQNESVLRPTIEFARPESNTVALFIAPMIIEDRRYAVQMHEFIADRYHLLCHMKALEEAKQRGASFDPKVIAEAKMYLTRMENRLRLAPKISDIIEQSSIEELPTKKALSQVALEHYALTNRYLLLACINDASLDELDTIDWDKPVPGRSEALKDYVIRMAQALSYPLENCIYDYFAAKGCAIEHRDNFSCDSSEDSSYSESDYSESESSDDDC